MRSLVGIAAVADAVATLADAAAPRRILVGIAGAPGAGKSTVADALVAALAEGGRASALLPMDGFHLPQAQLVRLGRRERMGAADTFDTAGYLATLDAVRSDGGDVRAPGFDRDVEEPVPGAVLVPAGARVVVTEGNWLLLPDDGWEGVAERLDLRLFLDLDDGIRIPRLVARHVAHGKTPAQARAWVARSDEANARRIRPTASRADAIILAETGR